MHFCGSISHVTMWCFYLPSLESTFCGTNFFLFFTVNLCKWCALHGAVIWGETVKQGCAVSWVAANTWILHEQGLDTPRRWSGVRMRLSLTCREKVPCVGLEGSAYDAHGVGELTPGRHRPDSLTLRAGGSEVPYNPANPASTTVTYWNSIEYLSGPRCPSQALSI